MKIEWGSQIRNYVMQPYKLVKRRAYRLWNQQRRRCDEWWNRRVLKGLFNDDGTKKENEDEE
jgi:protein subunit release factor B